MRLVGANIALALCILLSSYSANAHDLYLSTGAWQGYETIGIGQHFRSVDIIFSYGFTPHYIGGHDISQWNLKLNYNININPIKSQVYLTSLLIYNSDKKLFIQSPSPYPESGYYPSTALLGGLGIGFKKEIFLHHTLFIETIILSPEMERFYNNKDYDDPINDYFGMGVGYSYRF